MTAAARVWAGASCSFIKRGRAVAETGKVRESLLSRGMDALDHHAASLDDIELEDVIKKVSKVIVVDGATSRQDTLDPAEGVSVEAFEEALKEDNAALAEEFGVAAEPDVDEEQASAEEEARLSVVEAVASVRGDGVNSPYNWVLIGPK